MTERPASASDASADALPVLTGCERRQSQEQCARGREERPVVSIVIPTHRRPELLRRCLAALIQQDLPSQDFEIIVVEDGQEGSAAAVVEAFQRPGFPRVRDLSVPKAGPAAARNAGWQAASASVIAFTDDDAVPAPGWLTAGLAALRPGVDAVAGRTVVPVRDVPSDYERSVRGLETSPFLTCNLFCRKQALVAAGGFDPRFERAYREDSDLQFRLLDGGLRIVRSDEALVEHPARPAPRFVSVQLQQNQYFDALLYRKHPERFRATIRERPPWRYYAIVAALLASLAAALAGRWPVARLGAAVWLSLSAHFCIARLRPIRKSPGEVIDMIVTSVLIPPVAVYWRLRGALAFRVWFL